jgi:folate-dependent phosphoribosylglycinamide formyltransferase PurN
LAKNSLHVFSSAGQCGVVQPLGKEGHISRILQQMKVLVLSPYPAPIVHALRCAGEDVFALDDRIGVDMLDRLRIDWIVSYGYRHLIRPPMLAHCRGRAVNLHISLLPFNRGSDPNFWSWFDGTPKGVTIHQIDSGLDTGAILAQCEVAFAETDTLTTSYWKLRAELERLFEASWIAIRDDRLKAVPQAKGGTYHRQADKAAIFSELPHGFDTPVRDVEALGVESRRRGAAAGPAGP